MYEDTSPELAIGDGALGFWKALRQVYGTVREQRCWVHKTANVLNKLPTSVQPNFRVHPDMDDEPNVGLLRRDNQPETSALIRMRRGKAAA